MVFLHGGGAFSVGEVVIAYDGDGEGWGGEGCDGGCDSGA